MTTITIGAELLSKATRLLDNQQLHDEMLSNASYIAACNPAAMSEVLAHIDKLEAENERLRMQIVACGVVAMADTPTSSVEARKMHSDYKSDSCDAVARRVDECISLRVEIERLKPPARGVLVPSDKLAEMQAELERLRKDAERMKEGLDAVEVLIDNSSGVAGLHQNGDVASWCELRTGGRFEAWLLAFDEARDAAMNGTL